MNKLLSIVLIFLPNIVWACSYVGDAPSVNDLINNFDTHFENSEIVIKAKVSNVTETSNDFDVIDIYKSELLLEDTFTYHDQTSCDMTFKVHDEEYIIFGSIINNELYIFDANAMRSDNQQYTNLHELLINHDN